MRRWDMEFAGTQTEVETFRGQTVFATNNEKVGDVEKVLYDKATGKPEWLAVQTGVFGLKSRIAPFHGAERRADGVFVPYSAAQIQAAPELEGDEISQDLERRLASHYGLVYSETRSRTGLAQGRKSAPARQGSRRGRTPSTRSTQRGRTSRTRRSEGPTRDELYEQARRLGIEGRSKMNKAQLERAVGRQSGRASSKGRGRKANPFEVQKFLEAVGYPASKRELVREAKDQGAHTSVRSTLEQLPDKEFESPADVSKAISSIS
jgi:sporulation protein YlmC with PRC-barrel domain